MRQKSAQALLSPPPLSLGTEPNLRSVINNEIRAKEEKRTERDQNVEGDRRGRVSATPPSVYYPLASIRDYF